MKGLLLCEVAKPLRYEARVRCRRAAFTLIELMVVIAIIVVLMAIALPVFRSAREKARQTACMANLHQLAMAVRMYRMDMGLYPGPYDPVTGEGGMNDLYPAYVDNRKALICPDDPTDSGAKYVRTDIGIWLRASPKPDHYVQYHGPTWTPDPDKPYPAGKPTGDQPHEGLLDIASTLPMYMDLDSSAQYFVNLWQDKRPDNPGFFSEHYSSYNDLYNWVGYVGGDRAYSLVDFGDQYLHKGDNLGFWYAWYRWDPENTLDVWGSPDVYALVTDRLQYHLAQQTYWSDYNPENVDQQQYRLQDSLRRPLWDPGNPDSNAYDYMPYGMPSPVFPGLINRNAPENTIVTRCSHHRFTRSDPTTQQDIALRLDGSCVKLVGLTYEWAVQPQGGQ